MALTTSSVNIGPQAGWTLVATNPNYLQIRNRTSRSWQIGVTASGAPTNANSVLSMNPQVQSDGHVFIKDTASAGLYWIQVLEDGVAGETTLFGLLIDV